MVLGRIGLALAVVAGFSAVNGQAAAAPNHQTLAATPPMGWNPYNAFGLNYGQDDVLASADALVKLGLRDDGYRYVNIDDGWWLKRGPKGMRIRTNLYAIAKLPGGGASMRPFVDHLHAMGLKAGIYTDIGYNTCSQRWDKTTPNLPVGTRAEREVGSMDHQAIDVRDFSRWGFDFVKVDACGIADFGPDAPDVKNGTYRQMGPIMLRERPGASDLARVEGLYASFEREIRKARPGHPLVFSICAWGEADVNNWAPRFSQMWRTSGDINASWASMLHNFDSAASRSLFAGPGHWNDPDMLEVGNGAFDANHLTEARAHMSLWAVIAAPLILGLDLRKATPEILAVIRNKDVIAVNQDPAGHQGVIIARQGDGEIIAKPLAISGHKAVAMINRGDQPLHLSVSLAELNLMADGAQIRDLWHGSQGVLRDGVVSVDLAPHETALLRIEGRLAQPALRSPADMPARFHVTQVGYLPPDRTTKEQWVPARIGFLPSGAPITRGDGLETAAIGASAGSHLVVDLGGQFRTLRFTPGVKAGYGVKLDGKALAPHAGADGSVTLSLAGARRLELIAPPRTAGADTFIWHDLRFERAVN
ncbi:MAG: alpha-galactosidase [Sphingomonadales bacterium]|nr:alpha-galactosidase [Sphingomonadales bacterium]MDE2170311.1 alpha-galactosidase [Sphingomonadales bacterium]